MSTNIYPSIVMDETPAGIDAPEVDAACAEISEACKGWGTDEDGLIKALGHLKPDMRFKVSLRFGELNDKDLQTVMKKECGNGDFGKCLQYLAMPAPVFEAHMVKKALGGIGAKESMLYPILSGRSNEEMAKLKATYFDTFGEDMAVELAKNLGGDFERFIFYGLQGMEEEFDAEHHTADKAAEDAEAFHEAGEGKWGTDEKSFFELISKAPPKHLEAIDAIYQEKYGKTITEALDKELGGDTDKACRYAVGMKLKPYDTAAAAIKSACAGFGTNELALMTAIIRYDAIMEQVNEAHVNLYGKSVFERVDSEVGGDFQKLLMAILE